MTMPNLTVRISYAEELLQKLSEAQNTLNMMSEQIENDCDDARSRTQETNLAKMHEKRDKYIAQVELVKDLHGQMTTAVGNWLAFTHAPENKKRLLFPIRLLLMKSKTKATLRQCRLEISNIGIRNRLLHDELTRLAYTIRADAIKFVQNGDQYAKYQAAQDEKDEIIKRLQYLLPTLPGMAQAVVDTSDISVMTNQLHMIHA